MLSSAMTATSLKLPYALITLGVATRVYVLGECGGDPTWLTGTYFITTILFTAMIIHLTLKAVNPEASRDERYFGYDLLSIWTIMPSTFFLWGVVQRDLKLALLAFSLSSGVVAGFYLMIRAFRLMWSSRGVR